MRSRRLRAMTAVMCVMLVATASGVAYAVCGAEGEGGGGTATAATMTVAPVSFGAGTTVTVAISGASRAVPYFVSLSGLCIAASDAGGSPGGSVFLGPHAWIYPDAFGNIPPFEVEIPADSSVRAGDCYVTATSLDGVENAVAVAVTVVAGGAAQCSAPNGGLFEDLATNGCERHHMPSQDGSKSLVERLQTTKYKLKQCLPAIRMPRVYHKNTKTWGPSTNARDARLFEESVINGNGGASMQGLRQAFEDAAADARANGASEEAIQQARDAVERFNECIQRKGGIPLPETPGGGGGVG